MKKFFSAILIICLMIVMPVMVSCGEKEKENANTYSLAVTYVDTAYGEDENFEIEESEKEEFFTDNGYYYSAVYDGTPTIYFSSNVDISKKIEEGTNVEFVVYFSTMCQELEVLVNNEEPTTLTERLPSSNEEFEYVEFSFAISQNTEVVITGKA